MKSSKYIVWEMGAVLRSKGNLPLSSITVCGYRNVLDRKFGCQKESEMGDFLGGLLNASLYKNIRDVEVTYWVTGQHCSLTVWVEDSEDGATNIDADVVEAFSKLKWKW